MRQPICMGLMLVALAQGCGGSTPRPASGGTPPPLTRVDGAVRLGACDSLPVEQDLPVVRNDVSCVEASLHLLDFSAAHRVRFLYYDPQGNLYASTKADFVIQPEPGGTGFHRSARVTHRLAVAGQRASTLPGEWKVAAWLDGLTVSERLFQLEARPPMNESWLREVRHLYLELRYEEARSALQSVESAATENAVKVEALWWLALTHAALGSMTEARDSVSRLLELEPGYAVSPQEVEEFGGVEVVRLLEELRGLAHPDLYARTTALPEVELSPAEEAPVLNTPKRWYQQWWFYAGLGAVAIPVTAALADSLRSEPGPPSIELEIRGTRHALSGLLCEGPIELGLTILGGRPSYEAVFTVQATGGNTFDVRVPGVVLHLDDKDMVFLKQTFRDAGTIPAVSAVIDIPSIGGVEAYVRFGVLVRDSLSETDFDRARVGFPLPSSLADIEAGESRVSRQQIFDGIDFCPS